jgi:hypothetical protein
MKPGKARSLLFFVLLFAVAALALDASYGQSLEFDGCRQDATDAQGQHARDRADMLANQ